MAHIHVSGPWIQPEGSNHAELPVWDSASSTLFWVDMEPSPSVHRVTGLDRSTHVRAEFPGQDLAGGVFLREGASDDQIYIGTKLGWGSARFDATARKIVDFTELVNVKHVSAAKNEASWKPIRLNEATTDVRGRVWFATCVEGESDVKPALYLWDPSKRSSLVQVSCSPADLTMPNAMAFSGDRFYMGCSVARKIWRWRVDLDAENPSQYLKDGQIFKAFEPPNVPDGATVDSAGNLYVAVFNSGSVQTFSPEGELIRSILMPALCPTCPVFAGETLEELIITTHAVQDDMRKQVLDAGQADSIEEVRSRYPEERGGIYRVKLDLAAGITGTLKRRAI